jgi:hypothetical protein
MPRPIGRCPSGRFRAAMRRLLPDHSPQSLHAPPDASSLVRQGPEGRSTPVPTLAGEVDRVRLAEQGQFVITASMCSPWSIRRRTRSSQRVVWAVAASPRYGHVGFGEGGADIVGVGVADQVVNVSAVASSRSRTPSLGRGDRERSARFAVPRRGSMARRDDRDRSCTSRGCRSSR